MSLLADYFSHSPRADVTDECQRHWRLSTIFLIHFLHYEQGILVSSPRSYTGNNAVFLKIFSFLYNPSLNFMHFAFVTIRIEFVV